MRTSSIFSALLFVAVFLQAGGSPGVELDMKKLNRAGDTVPFEEVVIDGGSVSSRASVIDGKLNVRIPKGAVLPCNLTLPRPLDLSAYRYVLTTVENTGSGTVVLRMAVRDKGTNNYWEWGHHTFGIVVVRPGETKPLAACLSGPRPKYAYMKDYFPRMARLPSMFEFNFWRDLDASTISGIQILPVGADPDRERSLLLTPFRGALPISAPTEESLKNGSFFPFIDSYGQYNKLDWSDKIHADSDLVKMRKKEEAWTAEHGSMPKGWNKYGGWAAGPQLKATGQFRTEKYDGKWWFVDPEGRLFWSKGSTGVGFGIGGSTPFEPDQRKRFFAHAPKEAVVSGRNGAKELVIGQQMEALKYGKQTGDEWKNDLSIRRVWAFGLNTAGAWSPVRATADRKVPYTVMLHPWAPPFRENLMDPFSPTFREGIETAVQGTVGKEAGDPWCLGYFINNEIKWLGPLALGKAALTHNPTQPAKLELVKQLKIKYGTIQQLNASWQSSFATWDALAEKREASELNQAIEQDLVVFGNAFCDLFFKTISEVMKQRAPGKLYLGDRFNKNVPEAISACARYADVVSFNKYDPGIEHLQLPKGSADKPVIIGEFCFVRGGRRHDSADLGDVYDPDYRGRAYAQYLVGALANPAVVGCHWFQWGTQPVTGRGDGENYEQGFLDTSDTPYWGLAHYSRSLADHIYDIRLRGTSGFDYHPPSPILGHRK